MALHKAIVDLEAFTESINMLVYGDSGVGKTVFAGSAPKALILRAENGAISAYRLGSKAKVWKINTWEDFEAAYDWIEANPDVFEWVVVDSITKLQELCIRSILDKAVKDNPKRDLDIPAIQDHYKWQLLMKRFVVMFNDLPVNVLWTALAMHKEDQEGEDLVLPLITGKGYDISAAVCAEMNVVGYFRVVNVKTKKGTQVVVEQQRQLMVKTTPPYFAKDRYGTIGDAKGIVRDPTMPKVITMINAPVAVAAGASKTAAKKAVPARRAVAR